MEKALLKRVICNLNVNNVISVNYCSKFASLSGQYEIVAKKRGRGKNGSMLMELKQPDSDDTIVLSTKDSDNVVNVTFGGTVYGYASEADIPPVYEKDALNSITLKRTFKKLSDVSESTPITVSVVSNNVAELNGLHKIVSSKQLRGRSGQMVLTTSTGLELWSYRHSGIINSIELV